MIKVIMGFIRVDSEESMEEISNILNSFTNTLEDEYHDRIIVDSPDPDAMDKLFKDGYITEEDYMEIPELNSIMFYVD